MDIKKLKNVYIYKPKYRINNKDKIKKSNKVYHNKNRDFIIISKFWRRFTGIGLPKKIYNLNIPVFKYIKDIKSDRK